MKKSLDIILLVDEATIPPDDPHMLESPDTPTTEFHVADTLRDLGHRVRVLGAGGNVAAMAEGLTREPPNLVFNLTEHIEGNRLMDKNIAALLEMTGIPFTGAGPLGLLLCRDKRLCKQLLRAHRIRVPGFASFPVGKRFRPPGGLVYPLVVKPAYEDGSEGISNASLVANPRALAERVQWVHESFAQPVIAEEYVEGRELYVAVLGNTRLHVLPARECLFGSDDKGPTMATFRVKHNEKYRRKWSIQFGFAEDLDEATLHRIQRVCKRAYRAMQLRDYGRIDLRLAPDGRLVVLEVNPNPDIAYGEEVAEAAEKGGIGYEELLRRIVRMALKRYP
ncbi:MAG TPA: ATP-grasp domain-containing protein [Phycisphaerales bacterium]|nr:ATP-grasp domain-containing protein [Phycisphaerales bacterium]